MAGKRFQRQEKKAQKGQKQYIQKAKNCLKKNKEEQARMYLISAQNKSKEASNASKMAVKMELLADTVKSSQNNKTTMECYNKVTTLLQNNIMNAQVLATNLQNFNTAVDQTLIQQKLIQQLIGINNGGVELVADQMMDVLKKQIEAEVNQKLDYTIVTGPNKVQYPLNDREKEFLDKLNALT